MRKKKIIITGLAAVSSVAVLGITAFNASSQYRKSFENDVNIDTTSQLETVVHTPTDYTIDIEEHNFTEE